ncbi:MAG: hypothetical protein KAZ98_06055, partial [Prevotella sp.]|nr:hypothetical protein [Prevotella sp.]
MLTEVCQLCHCATWYSDILYLLNPLYLLTFYQIVLHLCHVAQLAQLAHFPASATPEPSFLASTRRSIPAYHSSQQSVYVGR